MHQEYCTLKTENENLKNQISVLMEAQVKNQKALGLLCAKIKD